MGWMKLASHRFYSVISDFPSMWVDILGGCYKTEESIRLVLIIICICRALYYHGYKTTQCTGFRSLGNIFAEHCTLSIITVFFLLLLVLHSSPMVKTKHCFSTCIGGLCIAERWKARSGPARFCARVGRALLGGWIFHGVSVVSGALSESQPYALVRTVQLLVSGAHLRQTAKTRRSGTCVLHRLAGSRSALLLHSAFSCAFRKSWNHPTFLCPPGRCEESAQRHDKCNFREHSLRAHKNALV